jgi:hypothetical protein
LRVAQKRYSLRLGVSVGKALDNFWLRAIAYRIPPWPARHGGTKELAKPCIKINLHRMGLCLGLFKMRLSLFLSTRMRIGHCKKTRDTGNPNTEPTGQTLNESGCNAKAGKRAWALP